MPNPSATQIVVKSASLLEDGDIEKAQKQLALGLKLYPNNYDIAVAYARVAERLKKWDTASQRWKYLRQKFPLMPLGYTAGILTLLTLNRDLEAEKLVNEGFKKFETDVWFIHSYASLALKKKDFEKALELYQSLQTLHPDHSRGFTGAVEVFIEARRFDEAETAARAARPQFPNDVWLAHSFANIATRRGEWKEAVTRWEELLSKFPDHKVAYELKDRALENSKKSGQ